MVRSKPFLSCFKSYLCLIAGCHLLLKLFSENATTLCKRATWPSSGEDYRNDSALITHLIDLSEYLFSSIVRQRGFCQYCFIAETWRLDLHWIPLVTVGCDELLFLSLNLCGSGLLQQELLISEVKPLLGLGELLSSRRDGDESPFLLSQAVSGVLLPRITDGQI